MAEHTHYDHPSVEGDRVSELRDELKCRGWGAIVAHTGGGCMSVMVVHPKSECIVTIGPDDLGPLSEVTSGGLDIELVGDYDNIRSEGFVCKPGEFVDACERELKLALGVN